MEIWALVVLYVLVFALLQVVVYRFMRDGDDPQLFQTAPPIEGRSVNDAADRSESDGRLCPHCGATNDPDGPYSYCRDCVNPLGA